MSTEMVPFVVELGGSPWPLWRQSADSKAPASPCKTCGAALVEPTATHCWPRCAQVPAPASLPVVDPLREAAQRDLRLAARTVLDMACTYKMPGDELSVPKHAIDRLADALRSALSTAPQREAVPVLTDEERATVKSAQKMVAIDCRPSVRTLRGLLAIIDRLSTAPLPVGGNDGW